MNRSDEQRSLPGFEREQSVGYSRESESDSLARIRSDLSPQGELPEGEHSVLTYPYSLGHTRISYGQAKEILTRATGFMDAYDYTLNPYSGCSFGCTYCYAAFFSRDTEKRDNWGYWVNVKENAVELLQKRLKRTPDALDGKLIYMSSVTDPYQPVERELKLTRRILEVMAEGHRPKLVVQTRSPDVVRDCDLSNKSKTRAGGFRSI